MERNVWRQTRRLAFSVWRQEDIELAESLWGDPKVTRYICASGRFTAQEVRERLTLEIGNQNGRHIQYWPVFEAESGSLIGCCGLRLAEDGYELGFHLRPAFWGKGYGEEAARSVMEYAFTELETKRLLAGHHPENEASRRLLKKLGFRYVKEEMYPPTGRLHPLYEIDTETWNEIHKIDMEKEKKSYDLL